MKTKLFASLFLLSILAQGCVISDDEDSSITVYNDSDYWIYELYVYEDGFDPGFDLLNGDPLRTDDSITVEVDCGVYNILVVDEFNTECRLEGIDVCFDDDGWSITNTDLEICDAFGVRATGAKKTPQPTSEAATL